VGVGEIAFSVQSVVKYLPWVRTIFIVTDGQVPPVSRHLIESGRVKVVDHEAFIPAEYLPTFNNRVIESCLHRIPGLSDIFLYNNDDYMHFSPVPRSAFYDIGANGRILLNLRVNLAVRRRILHLAGRVLPIWRHRANLHTIGISNAFTLLRGCAYHIPFHAVIAPKHVTQVFRTSTAERLEKEFGEALDANRRLRFRSAGSFTSTTLLYTMEHRWNPDDRVFRSWMDETTSEYGVFDFTELTDPGQTAAVWRDVVASTARFVCLNSIPGRERETFVAVMRQKGLLEPPGPPYPE
jgi:hypothetical protein